MRARVPPPDAACDSVNRWKYGTTALPVWLAGDPATARRRYAAAEISHLVGELDHGTAAAAHPRILDQSCAARAQGPDRLARGLAYAEYERRRLAPERQRHLVVVRGCGHDVRCVFSSDAGRSALAGR